MVKVTFVMEQHIGHRSYCENLKKYISASEEIDDTWVEITYQDKNSILQNLKILPDAIRGSLIGRAQARDSLKKAADVYFFNTQVPAALSGKIGQIGKYLVATDITPVQYDRMAKWYNHKPDDNSWISRYKHKTNLQVFRNAYRVLPWSTWTANSLIEDYGVIPENVVILSPGVDMDVWKPRQSTEKNCFRILFVGGDFYRKGGDILLEAFDTLQKRFPSMPLELALVTHTKLSNIPGVRIYNDLRPNSSELVQLYQSSDVFLLPSRAEAFGIAAVEASAVGLPVIASRLGGLTDIVKHDITGFLIEPDEIQSLVEHLVTLIENSNLRFEMGQAGLRHAMQKFDAAQNSAMIVQLVREAVRKNGN